MSALSILSGALPRGLPPRGRDVNPSSQFPFPGNRARGITQAAPHTGASDSAWHQEYIWTTQPFRKPAQSEGVVSEFLAQAHILWEESYKQLTAALEHLRTEYVFRNEDTITDFLFGHRTAATVLSNAVPELKKSFGQDVVLSLEAVSEEDGSTSLYAIVIWRGLPEPADFALEEFDERWWLNQVPQPGLTFTYELA